MSDGLPVDLQKIARLPSLRLGDEHSDLVDVQNYLRRFGYLPASFKVDEGHFDATTTNSLRKFQQFFGVDATGEIDEATRNAMTEPRCGLPDPSPLAFQTICGWDHRDLTYAFGASTGQSVGAEAAEEAVHRAFATFERAGVGLRFREVEADEGPDIFIEWTTAACPDLDMSGTTLAHADFPIGCSIFAVQPPLPIHFDDDEHAWNVGADIDIETVALHEIGHCLGLLHEPGVRDAVMFPSYSGIRRALNDDDLEGLRSLYPDLPS